jgi:ribonuclease Z
MFDLTFLGTSASVPSAERNHPGLLVEAGGHRIMVDCGEGTQRQLLRSGAGFRRLDRLLLTHAHFDHVLGIPGLFSTLRLRQSTDVMTIHGSPATLDVVVRILAGLWGEGRAPIPLQLVPLAEGRILDAGEFTIDGFPVRHRDTESFAFSFESQVRRHLLPDRLAALGVPDGPVRKYLAEGRPVVLADGRTIDSEDVLGPPEGRKKLVVVGDTETTDGLADHVREADLLVIEATFLERDAAMALDYGHHRGESGRARCDRRREATRPHAHLGPLYGQGDPGGGDRNIPKLPSGRRPRPTGGVKRCRRCPRKNMSDG